MVSILEGCAEGCGWAAAILAALSWGTFGVPIKCNVNVEVNFFVMQSYKTIVCFVTSWFVILLGEPVRWTSWGIISGLFWVPGAACGIYAIRNAGVAVAVGTWASIQVVSSFVFGIIIFQEKVKDINQTLLAFGILMIGLIGMSRYSESPTHASGGTSSGGNGAGIDGSGGVGGGGDYHPLPPSSSSTKTDNTMKLSKTMGNDSPSTLTATIEAAATTPASAAGTSAAIRLAAAPVSGFSGIIPLEIDDGGAGSSQVIPLLQQQEQQSENRDEYENANGKTWSRKDRIVLFGGRVALSRRQMGIAGAVVNGAWGGLNLIPLHYAQRDLGLSGAGYLISYATGSLLVCITIWFGLFIHLYMKKNYVLKDAYDALPPWHVRELGVPGLAAGMFYSVGNFCSILAVAYLGQGIGFSFCQLQLLISGLWGVFYFEEIQGKEVIVKWFTSATLTIIGIISLSYQHEGGGGLHR